MEIVRLDNMERSQGKAFVRDVYFLKQSLVWVDVTSLALQLLRYTFLTIWRLHSLSRHVRRVSTDGP